MNHTNTNSQADDSSIPDDVQDVAAVLDACGTANRAFADAGFESRIATATRPVTGLRLSGTLPAPAASRATGIRSQPIWAMRLAAMLAIAACLIAVRMASRSTDSSTPRGAQQIATTDQPATGDDSMDVAFALVGWSDESSSLDDLRTRAESLRSNIDSGVDMSEFLASEEGAT